jgi:diamine N-acetyltransferase
MPEESAVPVYIREATANDIPGLAALQVEINDLHVAALPHIFRRVVADAQTEAFLWPFVEDEGTHLFVAEEAGQLAGYVALRLADAPETPIHVPRRWVSLDTVVVAQAFRRRGIGAMLVEHVHAWANDRGVDYVDLTVFEFNDAARAFYEQLGYVTVSRRMGKFLPDSND